VNDADTGLVYMQQRYYEPLAGRFLSVDPVTTDFKTGEQFNRYAYVNNNPYKFKDPDGRFANFAVGFVVGAGIEASLQFIQSGKITSGAAIVGAGVSGALTGGASGVLSAAAARGATSALTATVKTAGVGAAAAVVGKGAEGAISGNAPTGGEMARAAAGGAVGGLIGGQFSNAPVAALEAQAAKAGVAGHVGTATLNAAQQGGKAAVTTSFTTEGAKFIGDASIASLDKFQSSK
jgi:RHS repeat-associated protein